MNKRYSDHYGRSPAVDSGRMRVGYLAYGLDRPLTGIGRYTVELARALTTLATPPELTLLTAGAPLALDGGRGWHCAPLTGCRLLPLLMTWGNVLIPRIAGRLKLQIVHDPAGVAPFLFGAGGARMVVTLQDVFPWSYPGVSTSMENLIYRCWLPRVLPQVDAVITVSARSRDDILRYLRIDPARLYVIPDGIAGVFRRLPEQQVREYLAARFGLIKPYILFVGSQTPRKNLGRCLEAFARLRRRFADVLFVVAGPAPRKHSPVERLASRLEIAAGVRVVGPVADDELVMLYNGAALFVFPSLYEGFGLPPLEAMACGAPVVCSNAASLPETAGEAALTVPPDDVAALTRAMEMVLTDRSLAADLRRRGPEHAARFSWERTAVETLTVYRRLLEC